MVVLGLDPRIAPTTPAITQRLVPAIRSMPACFISNTVTAVLKYDRYAALLTCPNRSLALQRVVTAWK